MKRGTGMTGIFPVAAVAVAASALTAGAFFSVAQAGCTSPAHYVRTGNHVELVGGCVGADDLPAGTHHTDVPRYQQYRQPADFVRARP